MVSPSMIFRRDSLHFKKKGNTMKNIILVLSMFTTLSVFASEPVMPIQLSNESMKLANLILKNSAEISQKLEAAGLATASIQAGLLLTAGRVPGVSNNSVQYNLILSVCPPEGLPQTCNLNAGALMISRSSDVKTGKSMTQILVNRSN